MKFDSTIFGVEKDGSFNSSINAIYQSAFGEDIYKSIEEKAANLLYFITKNHSFVDGNKRITASIFVSSKATLLGKASPLGLVAGYGLTALPNNVAFADAKNVVEPKNLSRSYDTKTLKIVGIFEVILVP